MGEFKLSCNGGKHVKLEIPIRMQKWLEFRSGDWMAEDMTFFIVVLTQRPIVCFLFVHSDTNKTCFASIFLCVWDALRKSFILVYS